MPRKQELMVTLSSRHDRYATDVTQGILSNFAFVRRLVGPSYGPAGRAVLHTGDHARPRVLRRGASIVAAAKGAAGFGVGGAMLADAMSALDRDLGNGATTMALLACSLAEAVSPVIAAGMPADEATGNLKRFAAATAERIRDRAETASDACADAFIRNAAGRDDALAGNILDACRQLGGRGEIIVDQAPAPRDALDLAAGFHIDGGFAHARLARRPGSPLEVADPLLLILRGDLSDLSPVARRLNQLVEHGRNLVIVADAVSGDALAALVANKDNPRAVVTAIAGPGKGRWRVPLLEDLAVFSGGRVVAAELGGGLESVSPADLGRLGRILITERFALAFDGAGRAQDIAVRKSHIGQEIEKERYLAFDRSEHRKRLARFGTGIAWLRIESGLDFEERRNTAEGTILGLRHIADSGVLPNGAAALLHAAPDKGVCGTRTEKQLFHRLTRAVHAPLERLLASGGSACHALLDALRRDEQRGFDVVSGGGSAVAASFPAAAMARAVRDAASVAGTVLTAAARVAPGPATKRFLL